MKFYKFCLLKAYFDKGYGLMSYPTKIFLLFGVGVLLESEGTNKTKVIIAGLFYGIFCFFLGLAWYKFHLVDAEHEVQNVVDPFVREMRKVYKGKN